MAFLEEMHQQFFIFRVRPHLPTVQFHVIPEASSPLELIEVRYLELRIDDDVKH